MCSSDGLLAASMLLARCMPWLPCVMAVALSLKLEQRATWPLCFSSGRKTRSAKTSKTKLQSVCLLESAGSDSLVFESRKSIHSPWRLGKARQPVSHEALTQGPSLAMPGYGYGYGASRESDSETSSRDSESSESLASEARHQSLSSLSSQTPFAT